MNRKVRYYLRGMGLGIFLTTLILSLVGVRKKNMTDEEIVARARELGMVTASELSLTDVGNTTVGIGTIVTPEEAQAAMEAGTEEQIGTEETQPEETGTEETGMEETGSEETAEEPVVVEETTEAPEGGEQAEETSENAEETTGPVEEAPATEEPPVVEEPVTEEPPAVEETPAEETPTMEETPAEETPAEEAPAEEPPAEETPAATGETVTITVTRGSGSETVARNCAKAGLVESASAFDKYLIDNGYSKSIRTGTFEIPVGSDMQTIAKILTGRK